MEQNYRAFGLTLRSELPLPGLPVTNDKAQVQIRRGVIPEWSGDATVRYGDRTRIQGQKWLIRFRAVPFASLIQDGNLVQFEGDPAQDEVSRLHILGSSTGALLFQRGMVPLHGNTIVSPNGAAMLVGKIGAGKSATTLGLLRRGNRLLADDISGVSFDHSAPGAAPKVVPGFPRLKLWKATLDYFNYSQTEFQRLRPQLDKFHFPVDDFCDTAQPLNSIYILQPSDSPGVHIKALSGLNKLEALRAHLYKIRFQDAIRNWPAILGKICRLADSVRVNIVERPRNESTLDAVADAIEADLCKSAG